MWQLYNLDKQYARYPHIRREEVHKLLKWLPSQPHLPHLNEQEVLLFYYACECSIEYTKQVIDDCFTFRTHNKDFFGNLDIESPPMQLVQKTVCAAPLTKRTQNGDLVVLTKLTDTNASNYDFVNSFKIYCMTQDMWLLQNGIIPGFIFVLDVTGMTFGHIARTGLLQLKNLLYFLQEAIPTRLIGIHFINASPLVDKIMNLITPFLKKELLEQIHVHSKLESFYKYVPSELLPQEYGGDAGNFLELCDIFYQQLRENRLEIMEYNNTHRVNEQLRPVTAKVNANVFGTAGNFKKLDID